MSSSKRRLQINSDRARHCTSRMVSLTQPARFISNNSNKRPSCYQCLDFLFLFLLCLDFPMSVSLLTLLLPRIVNTATLHDIPLLYDIYTTYQFHVLVLAGNTGGFHCSLVGSIHLFPFAFSFSICFWCAA